jgi:16S rRNA (adenine1518-N6/adenine1519-N6)-dimethyltransferase
VGAVGPMVRSLTPGDVRELAGRLGVRSSKRLGQNFGIELGTLRQISQERPGG